MGISTHTHKHIYKKYKNLQNKLNALPGNFVVYKMYWYTYTYIGYKVNKCIYKNEIAIMYN